MARPTHGEQAENVPEVAAKPCFSVLLLVAGKATRFTSAHPKV